MQTHRVETDAMAASLSRTAASQYKLWITGFIGCVVALRIAGILVSPLELGPDEAQYWRWSTTPAFGYYSKPPLIAWVISLFTGLFGTSEWAVRLPAPLLHGVTALILFRLGERIFDARVGVVAAIYYILMPGVTFSSAVMTTDAVLFPCWAMALLALWTLRERSGHWPSAVMLGLAVGLGFLAKYAMVYFLVGAAAAMMIDRPTRRALLSRQGLLACGLALLIVSPHLFWNLQNQFQTVGHTVDNANWQGAAFAPQNAIRFGVDQMGIFGPIGFLVLCGLMLALVTHWRRGRPVSEPYRWLACFVVPALGVILLQSMIARAHANWAATAYLAGTIWASAMFVSRRDVAGCGLGSDCRHYVCCGPVCADPVSYGADRAWGRAGRQRHRWRDREWLADARSVVDWPRAQCRGGCRFCVARGRPTQCCRPDGAWRCLSAGQRLDRNQPATGRRG